MSVKVFGCIIASFLRAGVPRAVNGGTFDVIDILMPMMVWSCVCGLAF